MFVAVHHLKSIVHVYNNIVTTTSCLSGDDSIVLCVDWSTKSFQLSHSFYWVVHRNKIMYLNLKGLSHEIRPVFWPVWMHLGLNVNRLWFLTFFEAPSIFGNCFKFWWASYQTFSEILRISEKDWQPSYRNAYVVGEHSQRTAELVINHSRRFVESPRSIDTLCSVSRRTANPEYRKIGEPRTQLSILLGDSTNLREGLVWNASILKITV